MWLKIINNLWKNASLLSRLEDVVASQWEDSWKSWKRVKTLIRFQWTDVQKFYHNSADSGDERSSRIVGIRTDCRQTVTVKSFVKKLNSLTEVRQILWRSPDNTCELRSAIQTWWSVWTLKWCSTSKVHLQRCTDNNWPVNEPRTVNPVNFTVILYNLESSSDHHQQQRLELYTFSYDKSSCYNNIKVPGLVSLFVKRLFMWCVWFNICFFSFYFQKCVELFFV